MDSHQEGMLGMQSGGQPPRRDARYAKEAENTFDKKPRGQKITFWFYFSQQREDYRSEGKCFGCGSKDHIAFNCPDTEKSSKDKVHVNVVPMYKETPVMQTMT